MSSIKVSAPSAKENQAHELLAQFSQIISAPLMTDLLMAAILQIFGDDYDSREGRTYNWNLESGEVLDPWYNKRGTELLYVLKGSAVVNGMTVDSGALVRIDAGEITYLTTSEGCVLTSHIFPYRRHLSHLAPKPRKVIENGPLVSIVVIAKDIENYIGHCISSCINQTHSNVEVIVVDDSSSDTTLQRATSLASYDNRIKVYSQSLGMNGVRRFGIERASGDFCMIIDGDDWLRDDAVERLVKIADDKSSECIAFGFDHYNDKTRAVWDPIYPSHVHLKSPPFYYEKTDKTAFETSHLHHTVWMYFFSTRLKELALQALIHIYQYEDIPFYLTLMQHAQNPTMCNYILHHYRRERAGQSTGNWVAVKHTQKRVCAEISVKHALSLMQADDWFHQLVLLYKIDRIVNFEIELVKSTGDLAAVEGWKKQWQIIARLFPVSLAARIIPGQTKRDFMAAHHLALPNSPSYKASVLLNIIKKAARFIK